MALVGVVLVAGTVWAIGRWREPRYEAVAQVRIAVPADDAVEGARGGDDVLARLRSSSLQEAIAASTSSSLDVERSLRVARHDGTADVYDLRASGRPALDVQRLANDAAGVVLVLERERWTTEVTRRADALDARSAALDRQVALLIEPGTYDGDAVVELVQTSAQLTGDADALRAAAADPDRAGPTLEARAALPRQAERTVGPLVVLLLVAAAATLAALAHRRFGRDARSVGSGGWTRLDDPSVPIAVLSEPPGGGDEERGDLDALEELVLRSSTDRRVVLVLPVTTRAPAAGVAAGLARALAGRGRPVAAVDLAGDAAAVHEVLGVALAPGLSDVVSGAALSSSLQQADGIAVLAAGGAIAIDGPDRTARHRRGVVAALAALERSADTVIAVAPVAGGGERDGLLELVDLVVLVVDGATTRRWELEAALGSVASSPAQLAGVAIVRTDPEPRTPRSPQLTLTRR